MGNLRYSVIAAIVVIVLGLLFGGQWAYTKYVLEKPVEDALKLPEIERAEFLEETETVVVKLKDVDNLRETYVEIQDRLEASRKTDNLKLQITDNRSPMLEDAWYQSQFAVHQAIMQGDFIAMHQTLRDIAAEYKLDRHGVFIDSDRVYVEFHQGGKNLYEVISREIPGREANAPLNGSDAL